MEKVKRMLKKVFLMPLLPALFIMIPSFALVFWVLIKKDVPPAVAYLSYLLSSYALILTVIEITEVVRWMRKGIKNHPLAKKVYSIPLVEQYFSEMSFRIKLSLYPSFVINLFYAGIKLFSGILYHSVWFGTLAVYYFLLAVMRFSLLRHIRKKGKKHQSFVSELKICRLCGMILLALNWALTGIIVLVVRENSGFEYPGMLIYIMALYTFYAVITAAVNVVKYRKHESPALSVIKVINLTTALVSLLSLETAMLTQFGAARDAAFRQMMSAATGAGVNVIVLAMAVYIIGRTTNQIKKGEE